MEALEMDRRPQEGRARGSKSGWWWFQKIKCREGQRLTQATQRKCGRGVRTQVHRGPCKAFALCVCGLSSQKSPCPPKISSPPLSHRGHLSFLWAVLGLMLEGPWGGSRKENHVETYLLSFLWLYLHPTPEGFPRESGWGPDKREHPVSPPTHTDTSLGFCGYCGWCSTGLSRPLVPGEAGRPSSPVVWATFSEFCPSQSLLQKALLPGNSVPSPCSLQASSSASIKHQGFMEHFR